MTLTPEGAGGAATPVQGASMSGGAVGDRPTGRRPGGMAQALTAYVLWGFLPLYLHLLRGAAALEIVCHRVVWSCVIALVYLAASGRLRRLAGSLSLGLLRSYGAAALLISANWGLFIWGVNSGRTIEASLGYFLTPILSVLLGVALAGERLSRSQIAGVLVAGAGAAWICVASARFPWLAFALGATFGLYGLVKKRAPLAPTEGLALETALVVPPALAVMAWMAWHGRLAFGAGPASLDALLIGAGAVTFVPLALFAAASWRLPLATLGMLQYVTPTMQFFDGAVLLHEPLGARRLVGFAIVWVGLAVYASGLVLRERRLRATG